MRRRRGRRKRKRRVRPGGRLRGGEGGGDRDVKDYGNVLMCVRDVEVARCGSSDVGISVPDRSAKWANS